MKVPINCELRELDASSEGLGIILDLQMSINHKIDFPVDEIKIVPSKGVKLDMWEVACYQAARKLVEKEQIDTGKDFGHFVNRIHILSKYIREAMLFSMSELSDEGKHVFTAYIDRPKGFKKQREQKKEPIEEIEEPIDPMAALIDEEMNAPEIEPEIEDDEIEEEEEEIIEPPKKIAKKKVVSKSKAAKEASKGGIQGTQQLDAGYNSKMTSYLYKPTGKVKSNKMAVVQKPGRQYVKEDGGLKKPVIKSRRGGKIGGRGFGANPFK